MNSSNLLGFDGMNLPTSWIIQEISPFEKLNVLRMLRGKMCLIQGGFVPFTAKSKI